MTIIVPWIAIGIGCALILRAGWRAKAEYTLRRQVEVRNERVRQEAIERIITNTSADKEYGAVRYAMK
jgi:hypothetical protein